jgi:hypothetical protein
MQAYQVKQALLAKIKGYKANCFARFLAFLQHMADTDEGSQGRLTYDEETGYFKAAAFVPSANKETGCFEVAAFAPSATINTCRNIQSFVALDACYTKSKYLMMLMIAVGIDTNDNAIPLA